MSKNDGGPAFPIFNAEGFPSHSSVLDEQSLTGITVRDYFAAKAMQAYISCSGFSGSPPDDALASYAYSNADAMIAERNK